MRFTILQPEFSKALLSCGKSVLTRANLPILSNVLLKASAGELEVLSTNLETAIKVNLKCKIEREGDITVNGKTLFEFISQLPEVELVVEKLGEEVVIGAKGYSGRFATLPSEEFPVIPKIEKGINYAADASEFARRISKTVFSAAVDEGRPILTGVWCEIAKNKMRMVATDGYRLGYEEVGLEGSKVGSSIKLNVPARALGEVAKIIGELESKEEDSEEGGREIRILLSEELNQINFKIENVEFTSRLIEGEYPNWQKIIPATFNTKVKLNKADFMKLVKIASIFARDAGNIVRLKFEPDVKTSGSQGSSGKIGTLTVAATSSQVGSSDASCEVEMSGPGGEIAFNFRYILEVLSVIEDEEISFEMNESLNPGKITLLDPKDPFFHIIMPVRLQA